MPLNYTVVLSCSDQASKDLIQGGNVLPAQLGHRPAVLGLSFCKTWCQVNRLFESGHTPRKTHQVVGCTRIMNPPMSGLALARWQGTVKDNLYRSSRGKRKCSGMDHHHPDMWGCMERLGIGCNYRKEYTLKVLQGNIDLPSSPPWRVDL